MFTEQPSVTTIRFISSWRYTDKQRLYEEIKSVSNETNRRNDVLPLIVKDGELIDSATGNVINFRRETSLEKIEGRVWDELKSFASNNEFGKAAWISPILDGVYPTNKIVFYEINYTNDFPPQKILLSTTILFDTPKNHCLGIAKEINPLMANVKNVEFLRGTLLKIDKNFNITSILEKLGQTNSDTPAPSQELINYFVEKIKSGISAELIVEEMQQKGVLGNRSISCPTRSGSALSFGSKILDFTSKEKWSWKIGDCVVPECGRKNVLVGPCSVCKKCQEKFDRQESALAA